MKLTPLPLAALAFCIVAAVATAAPVARWGFGTEETSRLTEHGGVHRDQPGPRPPEFPDFEPNNTAVRFDGGGAHFSFADPGANSAFDFTNGDAITLEAWVNVEELGKGENRYVISKGRTGAPGFARDNQNWALRVREAGGKACVSFLFATPREEGAAKADAHWHRWTTTNGFTPGSGWHHVAAAYRFGEPQSVRGWIDGRPLGGAWDMGGASKAAPVVDDDAIWIGSSQGGNPGNSFRGLLDEIAIHRELLSDDTLRTRFRREGPEATVTAKAAAEIMPDLGPLPAGRVLAVFHEGLPAHNRWPLENEKLPAEITRWLGDEFLMPRLPFRYDDWGIRAGWKAPVLARLAAEVTLAPGTNRFLLRSRGMSRLWVNGAVIARTKAHVGTSDGHEPIPAPPALPLPGLRPVGYGDQEAFGEAVIGADGKTRIVFESIAGGQKLRAEPGELLVAVQTPDGKSFTLLQPTRSSAVAVPLTDAAVPAAAERASTSLIAHDDATRRALAESQDAFWKKRHDLARAWTREHSAPAVPAVKAAVAHPVDAFLAAKIERSLAASAGASGVEAKRFHSEVLPILREQCFRCHGEKEKAGLRLNTREAALRAGESGKPAVVPGNAAASQLIARIRTKDDDERMPPKGEGLTPAQIAILEAWVKAGAVWPSPPVAPEEVAAPPVIGDAAFLRRAFLDTVGVPPSESELRAFLADRAADKRARMIDRLLADERWADHWVSYWQDVLAENPNMLKPSLNNSGPFRWFLHEALRDGKPLDRLVTELVLLRGSEREGGSAGFGLAADNDAPFAAKGHILAGAFLGIELQCARCHDSPYHSTKQRDLYSLAALLERKTVTVPKTSTVPAGFFEKKARESLIKATLKPGETIAPAWPFAVTTGCADGPALDALMQTPGDTRERLAALLTAPQNTRFAQVVVNRVWRRLMGAGFVEPAHDWEGHAPSHPELLAWLAAEFVTHDYDVKHVARLILTSQAYQRSATGRNLKAAPELRFFAAPERRRLTAEQVVDSLYAAAGQRLDVEEITFDPDGRRPANSMINLGAPSRAWMFASLSNERDRPSLSLPRAQAVADVLEAFGWVGSRQSPRTDRESDPNVLQPGVLANSMVSTWITRAAEGSGLAQLAVTAESPEALVDSVYLRFLSRVPTSAERAPFAKALAEGFEKRLVPAAEVKSPAPLPRLSKVSWSNHLVAEATSIKLEMERRARAGTQPDPRLHAAWREVFEDFVWSVVNSPEFVWVP